MQHADHPYFLPVPGNAWRPGGLTLTEQNLDLALDRLGLPGERYRDRLSAQARPTAEADAAPKHGAPAAPGPQSTNQSTNQDNSPQDGPRYPWQPPPPAAPAARHVECPEGRTRSLGGRKRGPALAVDVGCGSGATLALLRGRGMTALGVDLHPKGPDMVRADAARLPLASGSVDLVVSECVLSLLPDPHQALAEWSRVLRKGGILLLSDMCLRESVPGNALPRQGAVPVLETARRLAGAGLSLDLWRDNTKQLRELAAHLVWEGACAEDMCRWLGASCDVTSLSQYGYSMWLARKEI